MPFRTGNLFESYKRRYGNLDVTRAPVWLLVHQMEGNAGNVFRTSSQLDFCWFSDFRRVVLWA